MLPLIDFLELYEAHDIVSKRLGTETLGMGERLVKIAASVKFSNKSHVKSGGDVRLIPLVPPPQGGRPADGRADSRSLAGRSRARLMWHHLQVTGQW